MSNLLAVATSLLTLKSTRDDLTTAIQTASDDSRRLEGSINWASAALLSDADIDNMVKSRTITEARAVTLTDWRTNALKQCAERDISPTLFVLSIRKRNLPTIEQNRRFVKGCYAERDAIEAAIKHELSLIEDASQREFLSSASPEALEAFIAEIEAGKNPGRTDSTQPQRLATETVTNATMTDALESVMSSKS